MVAQVLLLQLFYKRSKGPLTGSIIRSTAVLVDAAEHVISKIEARHCPIIGEGIREISLRISGYGSL